MKKHENAQVCKSNSLNKIVTAELANLLREAKARGEAVVFSLGSENPHKLAERVHPPDSYCCPWHSIVFHGVSLSGWFVAPSPIVFSCIQFVMSDSIE